MNCIFKSLWSTARQQYVATDEVKASRGKSCKSIVAVTVGAALLGIASASLASYVPSALVGGYEGDPGKIGDAASWETPEYQKDWGLAALNASKAYALGFHGQGVAVGVMDSGALLQKHPELAGDRFHASTATGTYGSTGNRYQLGVNGIGDVFGSGSYKEGEKFDISGQYIENVNDTHGTHVTGTVGANRDGSEFHGVAWGSDIYVGNTGGTDNTNYGPFQDYNYFRAAWGSLAQDLIAANGADRGGVINNSFGTNLRTSTSGGSSYPTNTTEQTEYEYFLFKKVYADKYQGTDHAGKDFVDAAWDAVKGTKVVQVFTTGNRNFEMPYYRPLYPYFNPEAEKQWIAVAGLQKDGKDAEGRDKYKWITSFNEAGNAKWWTIAAPGESIYSSIVYDDHYESTSEAHPLGSPGYAFYSGTSMAAPHVSGAMGVLMSRYQDMDATQVRDVMFTTARHTNYDGSNFTGWTAEEGVPDVLYGWGTPDLDKGMFGPGQFLGAFDYNLKAGSLDVWANDITQTALNARKIEDDQWMAATKDGTDYSAKFYDGSDINPPSIDDATITKEEAEQFRKDYYAKRVAAIEQRRAEEYKGSLIKRGEGTLVMTGANTYEGDTTVEAGTLMGFTESFGKDGGNVLVNGGKFSVLSKYTDELTQKGELTSTEATKANVTVNNGGTYVIAAGQDVNVGALKFNEGSFITIGSADTDVLKKAMDGEAQTGTVTADTLEGKAVVNPDYAFFKTDIQYEGNKVTGTLSRDEDATFAKYSSNANGVSIGSAIDATAAGALYDSLIGADKATVQKTTDSLSSDFLLNAQNAAVVNTLTMTRAVKDQAIGVGSGRVTELNNGTATLWATGVGSWGTVDYGNVKADNDFYVGLIGAEVKVHPSTKVGVFFGAGHSEFKGGTAGKLESDDLHVGLYGVSNIADTVGLTYGATYTKQDRDGNRSLWVAGQTGYNAINNDADITQLFVEAAYKGLNTDKYAIEPYVGLSWLHVKADDFSEQVESMTFNTDNKSQNIQVTTLGVRGSLPLTAGTVPIALKGDLAWNHYFGDTEAEANFSLAGSGVAAIKGGELDNQFVVGLGVEAQLTKTATFGLSYTGAYDGDVTSSGVTANLRFVF